MIARFPPPVAAPVKSIQAFSITIASGSNSNTATISSVDTSRAVVQFNGQEGGAAADIRVGLARLVLTDATTVTATRANNDGVRTLTVKGQVVEFN